VFLVVCGGGGPAPPPPPLRCGERLAGFCYPAETSEPFTTEDTEITEAKGMRGGGVALAVFGMARGASPAGCIGPSLGVLGEAEDSAASG
jgi:hypothetical protein